MSATKPPSAQKCVEHGVQRVLCLFCLEPGRGPSGEVEPNASLNAACGGKKFREPQAGKVALDDGLTWAKAPFNFRPGKHKRSFAARQEQIQVGRQCTPTTAASQTCASGTLTTSSAVSVELLSKQRRCKGELRRDGRSCFERTDVSDLLLVSPSVCRRYTCCRRSSALLLLDGAVWWGTDRTGQATLHP